MTTATKRKLEFLTGFAVFFGALWFFWSSPVIYPLKIFVVLLHEVSHAAAALATGGTVERIVLDPRQGGACYCPGGNAFVTLSAGYLGSLAWGALLVSAAQAKRIRPELLVGFIGAIVVVLTALYVRSVFGIVFGIGFALTLLVASNKLSRGVNRTLLLALGLTSALYAVLDIKSDVLDRPEAHSDAYMLSEITGVPTMAWGVIWIGIAVAALVWLFRREYRRA
jgi:hypothetical protein